MVDASALLDGLVRSDDHGERVRDRLESDPDQHAPHILKAEALSGLRRLIATGEVAERRGPSIARHIMDLYIETYPIDGFISRIWQLRENLTVYDGWYVAMAETFGTALVTTDHRLARAPDITCEIALVE